jgi:hypothetical protein
MLKRILAKLRSEWGMTLLLLLALSAAAPLLFHAGFLNTRGGGDSPFLLFRLHQLYAALADGHFPVRWMPDAAFGLGYPFFSYYAALPYYVAALFRALGASYVLSLKWAHLLGFLLAGGGMYAWVRRVTGRQDAGLLASAVYTFAPFHLVNVYVRGDSLSEFWAMVWFPLILLALHRAAEKPTFRRLAALAASYGALVVTHNVSALIFSPFIVIYGLAAVFGQPQILPPLARGREFEVTPRTPEELAQAPTPGGRGGVLVRLLLAGLLGLALSAWFWLPAMAEQGAAQLGEQATGYFFYGNHFRAGNLVQRTLLFGYDIGAADSTPFSMGLVQAALMVAGLVAMAARLRRWRRDGAVLFCLALATFMVTPLSRPLWEAVPLLALTQFPWRFLSIQALFGAVVAGALAEAFPRRWGTAVAMAGSALMLFAGLGALRLDFIPLTDDDVTAERLQWYEAFSGNIGTTIRHEYLPVWTDPRPYTSALLLDQPPTARFLEGEGAAQRIDAHANRQTWLAAIESGGARVGLPLLYWPGWRAWVDGEPVDLVPASGLGYVQLDLPQGAHEIVLRLGRTPLRLAAELISLTACVLTLGMVCYPLRAAHTSPLSACGEGLIPPCSPLLPEGEGEGDEGCSKKLAPGRGQGGEAQPRFFAWIAIPGFLIILAILFHFWPNPAASTEMDTLNADFNQEAYYHLSPDGIRFADGSRLLSYEIVSTEPLRVRMVWAAPTGATVETALVPPPPLAQLGAPEGNIVTGWYVPRLTLTDPETGEDIPALTADGQTRGAVYLRPIVLNATSRGSCESRVAELGPVSLCSLAADHTGGALQIAASWQTGAQLPQNEALALRLRDSAGQEWAALDAQAGGGGMFPTALWPPGEVIPDGYRLEVTPGAPPSGDYTLALTLYDPATLAPLGSYEQSGVILSATTAAPGLPTLHDWPDQGLQLVGVSAPDGVTQGDPLSVDLEWVTSVPLSESYRLLWTLGDVWTTETPLAPGSDTQGWEEGIFVRGVNALHPPGTLPPGAYRLTVQLLDGSGHPLGEPFDLGEVTVAGRERLFEPPALDVTREVTFGETLRLWGYDFSQTDDTLALTIAWGAVDDPDRDYAYFVHVFDPATEHIVAQLDTMPGGYTYPTTRWVAGEVVVEEVSLDLSAIPPGTYHVALGWYDPETEDRLPAVEGGERLPGDRVALAERVVR